MKGAADQHACSGDQDFLTSLSRDLSQIRRYQLNWLLISIRLLSGAVTSKTTSARTEFRCFVWQAVTRALMQRNSIANETKAAWRDGEKQSII